MISVYVKQIRESNIVYVYRVFTQITFRKNYSNLKANTRDSCITNFALCSRTLTKSEADDMGQLCSQIELAAEPAMYLPV